MASRRSERRALAGAPEWAGAGPLRQSLSQRSGEALREGDAEVSTVLVSVLRSRERIERATHGFHAYPAGLHPDAAAALLSLGSGPVLDPFCGGGTVLVEAMLAGRETLGCDINPVATLIARARTTRTTEAERTVLRSVCRKAAEAARRAGLANHASGGRDTSMLQAEVPDVAWDWYDPWAIVELDALRHVIGKDPLARAIFSSILVKVSRRESETANRRIEGTRPPGTTATLFHKRAREFARQLEELESLTASQPEAARARVHREDARELRERGEFGLVATSPPYPGVYDYLQLQQLRVAWLGLHPSEGGREELGSRRAFRSDRADAVADWKADTHKWVRAAAKALRPGGRLAVVIGDGLVAGRPVDSLGPLGEAAHAEGMVRVARATVERWDEGVERMRPEHAVLYASAP